MKTEHKVLLLGLVAVLLDQVFGFSPEVLSDTQPTTAWIGMAIGAATQLASGIAGTIQANKQQQKIDEAIDAQERRLDAWRDSQMNTNYLDRADSREMLRRVAQHNDEQMKALSTNAVKGGASEEAKVAAAGNLTRNYADAIGSIAAAGQRHRDNVQNQYLSGISDIEGQRLKQLMDNDSAAQLSKGISGMGNVLSEFDWGSLIKKS